MDNDLVNELLINLTNVYGYSSKKIESKIYEIVDSIRLNERRTNAKIFYRLLLDNLNLPVIDIVNKVKNNEFS